MEIKTYLLINLTVSPATCENIIMWNGDTTQWSPPEGYLALPADSTTTADWDRESKEAPWALVERPGGGRIGYMWDGQKLITTFPPPVVILKQPDQQGAENF